MAWLFYTCKKDIILTCRQPWMGIFIISYVFYVRGMIVQYILHHTNQHMIYEFLTNPQFEYQVCYHPCLLDSEIADIC
jgi:hypothetical protein